MRKVGDMQEVREVRDMWEVREVRDTSLSIPSPRAPLSYGVCQVEATGNSVKPTGSTKHQRPPRHQCLSCGASEETCDSKRYLVGRHCCEHCDHETSPS
jgi:hypothetical protein